MAYKILVVDDITNNIQLLGSILGKAGYAVSYATSGTKALQMTDEQSFDLILLDVMMPEMDGFAVCKELKAREHSKDIPVLFLTAKSETADIVDGLKQGAVDYLTKPFNAAELLARVKTHLALREARQTIVLRNWQLQEKNEELEKLLEENRRAASEIQMLQGILPICATCKKIRDDSGDWQQIESYIGKRSEAEFSHGICPDCLRKNYPEYANFDKDV